MVSSNKLLQKCEQLAGRGILPELTPGMIVARGFADLGFEEFTLIRQDTILSLYTGKVSSLPEAERSRFFPVPSCDQLVDLLLKSGCEVVSLNLLDQRVWKLVCKDVKTKQSHEFSGAELQEVFLDCLLYVCLQTRN